MKKAFHQAIHLFLLIAIPFLSTAQKNASIEGTWVGTFTFNSGTQYAMQLKIADADKKSFRGTAIWPDYFNSGSDIKGTIKKNELTFNEVRIAQGLQMDLSYTYSMEMESNQLLGQAYGNGNEPLARFELQKLTELPKKQQKEWQVTLDENKKKYGEVILLDEIAASTGQEIYDQYLQLNAFEEELKNMVIWGSMNLNAMEFPIYGVFEKSNQYVELSFQNQKFIKATNDSLEWEYNPANDQVIVKMTEPTEDDAANNFFGTNELDAELIVKQAHKAVVNGESAIRLVMDAEETLVVFIANKVALRIEKKEDIMDFDQYRMIDDMNFPTWFHQVNFENNTIMKMDSILLNTEINDSIFQLTDELRAKITFTEDHEKLNDTGNQFFENGEYDKALNYYNQAIAKNSVNYIYFFNRGSAHLELGNYYEAITDLGRSIELNDSYAMAWNKRGLAKYKLGDYKNAKSDFEQAVALDDTFEDAWTNIGLSSFNLDEYETAAGTFKKLTEMNPEKGLHHYNHAYTLYQLGDDSLAIKSFKKAIENGYDGDGAYNMLGVAQYRTNLYQDAVVNFKKAISLKDDYFMYHLNLGKSYYNLDSFELARKEILVSLDLNPDSEDALNYLGLSYYGDKDYPTAINYFTKAIDMNDGNAVYFDNRAYAKAAMMNYTGAIKDFNESINLYAKDSEIYYQRGLMNMNLNNRFDACTDFQKAIDLGNKKAAKVIEEHCDFLKTDEED